ncbi:MAG: hypothetical protein ACLGJB_09925, partial [Blastocatellia bacterium]
MKKGLKPLIVFAFTAAFLIFISTASASDAGKNKAGVTFNKDVAPIFYKDCVQCHRPGEIAPMSL